MNHKPENHQEWQDWRDKFRENRKNGRNQRDRDPKTGSDNPSKTLVLSDKMKTALMTNHGLSELQYQSFLSDCQEK